MKLARHRNCGGKFKPAKNVINGHLYESCPKFIFLEEQEVRFIVELYMDCRESRVLPVVGSWMEQTAFTVEVFKLLDNIVAEWKIDQQQKANNKAGKADGGRQRD